MISLTKVGGLIVKKIILIVVTFLITVLNVNAESIEYNGYIPGVRNAAFLKSNKINDKYLIWESFAVSLWSDAGRQAIECESSVLFEDELVCFNTYYDSESSTYTDYITLYDSNFNEIISKETEMNNLNFYYYIVLKYNDYYVLLDKSRFYIDYIFDSSLNVASDDVYYEIEQYYYSLFEPIINSIVEANYDFIDIIQIENNQLFLLAGAENYLGVNLDCLLYDETGNLLTKVDILTDDLNVAYAAAANNGIYIAYSIETGGFYLEKYDLNGNLVYDYSLSELANHEFPDEYILSSIYVDENEVNITISDSDAGKVSLDPPLPSEPVLDANAYLVSFALNYDITTNITGFGDLNVEETGVYNEEKVMQITPEPGNEISDLVITDSAGNNISYTDDYKFIMPNSDVVIDVTFELKTATPSGNEIDIENPSTGAVLPISILIGGIIVSFVIYNYTKKKRVFTKL